MMRSNKEEIQKHHFDNFVKSYKNLPPGEIIHSDKPDIIIDGVTKIGIEITNFYLEDGTSPESEQKQRILRKEVINLAHKKYLIANGKKIDLSFGFDKNNPIKNRDELVEKIVKLAKRIEDYKSGAIYKHLYEDIKEIESVYVNSMEYDEPKWRIYQVYTGQIMSKEGLINVIKEKEEKAKTYQRCDAYWLLIVVDFMDRAQDQEIYRERLGEIKSNIYEKIFIYKTVYNHIVSVK